MCVLREPADASQDYIVVKTSCRAKGTEGRKEPERIFNESMFEIYLRVLCFTSWLWSGQTIMVSCSGYC